MRRLNAIVTISSLPALLAASWFYYPRVFDGPTVCMFKLSLGLPCFGCGMTRAFCCMAHGDFARMFLYHPVAPLALAWIAAWWALEVRGIVRHATLPAPRWFGTLGQVLMFTMISFWLTRMTVFFASPEGVHSLATKNLFARIVHWDWSNTHEVIVDKDRPSP